LNSFFPDGIEVTSQISPVLLLFFDEEDDGLEVVGIIDPGA
jgi:hypothetical protein